MTMLEVCIFRDICPQHRSHTQTKEKEMKFKNVAWAGMLFSVFAWGGHAWADATVIASKAYVDAKDALKQDKLKTGAGGNVTVSAGNGNASTAITGVTASGDGTLTFTTQTIQSSSASDYISDGSNALELTSATDKAPSVTAVIGAAATAAPVSVANGTATVTAGDDKHFITSKAVGTAFDNLDATGVDGSSDATTAANRGKPVVAVSQTNGLITAELGTVTVNGIADGAVTADKLATDAVETAKIKDGAVNSAKIEDETIVSADVKDGELKYQNDMNNTKLFDINTGAAPANDVCTEAVPCMLTYYRKGGKVYTRWSPLASEGLTPAAVTTDAGSPAS